MLSFKKLLHYSLLGLTIKEVLVAHALKFMPPPVNIQNVLNIYGINVKERQLCNILTNLEKSSIFTKFRFKSGLLFAFSFYKKQYKRYHAPRKILTCKQLQKLYGNKLHPSSIKNNKDAILCCPDYLYNIYIKVKRNYDAISNINKSNNNKEEDITITKVNHKEHDFVVNKYNYLEIKEIKERFKSDFPNKNAYISKGFPKNFNYELLRDKIKKSNFLMEKNNLGFNWFLCHYDAIINDYYETRADGFSNNNLKNFSSDDFSQRKYTKEDLADIFTSLDEW